MDSPRRGYRGKGGLEAFVLINIKPKPSLPQPSPVSLSFLSAVLG